MAHSTCESEYVALGTTACDCSFLKALVNETKLFPTQVGSVALFEDNNAAQSLAQNQLTTRKTRHINIKFHSIREKLNAGEITLTHIPSADNIADIMTKNLPVPSFSKFRNLILGSV